MSGLDDEDSADESDAEDDPVDWERAKTAARDRDGSVRWRVIWRAIRGRRSDHDDMLPTFAGFLLLLVVSVATLALDGGYTLVDTLAWGTFLLLVYGFTAVRGLARRLDEYHQSDDDVESRLLAERYAAGDLDDEEFDRRIDILLEDGPAAVRELDASDEDGGGDHTGEDNPRATLRQRFATGEIDEDEYRSRLETLRETTGADEPSAADRERELDRE